MADCTAVILVFRGGGTKTIDASKIDSIFFDDDKAKCFAKHCLPDDPGGTKPVDKLKDAIQRGGGGGQGAGPGGGSEDVAYDGGGQTATLSSPVEAATQTMAEPTAGVCIHETNCTWDCGPHLT